MDLLQRLLAAPGVYWGQGDGPESGPFLGRLVVEPQLSVATIRYEAHGAQELQHIEYAVLGRTSTGLILHTSLDTRPEMLSLSEREPGVFRLDGPTDLRVLIETPEADVVSYAWWWSPPGETAIERSRVVARRVAAR